MIKGKITNMKLVVSDLERSLDFYKSVFGLEVGARLDFTGPDVTEVMLDGPDGTRVLVLLHSDLMPAPKPIPGYAPLVVQVDDISVARSEIEKAGYQVAVGPLEFGPVGIVMVADPDGYLIEIVAGDPDAVQGPPAGTKIPHPIPQIHG
ncbi:VOC family protein [Nocardia nova]|uniref:VOC family protein n=1 Tax=Nocardia nova TaxID=37330 RepID=UPI0033E29197